MKKAGPHFTMHGDKGSIVKYGMDSQEEQLKNGMKPGDNGYGVDIEENFATLETEEESVRIPTKLAVMTCTIKGVRDSIISGEKCL